MGVSATRSFTVNNDVTPPTSAITSPSASASLRGTVTVTATAEDDFGVTKVEFYDGTLLLGTATSAPYGVSWNTLGGPDGAHTLTVKAFDGAGHVHTSWVGVTVDNTVPTVAITSPANGASLFLSTTIQASASDNRGVTQVVFYDGATVIGTDTTAPYSVSWSLVTVSKGTHTLTAKAHDVAGNVTTSAAISVKVN